MAEHRRPTIADRENDYQKKRRMVVGALSPERLDYFADGKTTRFCFVFSSHSGSIVRSSSSRCFFSSFFFCIDHRGDVHHELIFIGVWSCG